MLKRVKNYLKNVPLVGTLLIKIRDLYIEIKHWKERNRLKRIYPLKTCGISREKRDVQIIVSLTSIGSRIKIISLCIRMLLNQSFRPDKVILWLSEYDMSGNKIILKDQLPKELKELIKRGLEIRFCKDIGPHGKLIYALKAFPEAIVVTADDDMIYPKDWLEKLFESYKKNTGVIHCYRARLISFNSDKIINRYLDWSSDFDKEEKSLFIFPLGVDGVLYPPGVLNEEVFNEDIFREICPKGDDIWFKAMSLLNNTYCKKICLDHDSFRPIPGSQVVSLFSENIFLNDEQIKSVFKKYNLFEKLLGL